MTETTPEHESNQPAGSAELPQRSLDEIAAAHEADSAAVKAEYGEAMSQEERCQQIGEKVMTLATDGGEGEEHLAEYLEHDAFPEGMNECLLEAEQKKQRSNPDYDVTDEEPRKLARILARGLRRMERQAEETEVIAAETAETEATDEKAAEVKKDDTDYLAWEKKHAGDFVGAVNDAENLPVGNPASPELVAARAQLMQFQRILRVAQNVSPADHAIINQRMATLDMSQGVPNAVSFIQSSIFSSPENPSGVSDAAQAAIAAEFKLTPRSVVTGSDYENAMNETVLDEDGNEVPAYTEDDSLKFGVGIDGYTSTNGEQQFMRATPEHGQAISLDVTALSPARKAVLASYLDTWRMAEDAGETDFLLSLTQYDIRGGAIVDEIQLIQAAQVVNALHGGRAGYNGEIVRGDDTVGMMRWQAQLRNPKGDAGRSDRNASATDDNMQALGIRDESGKIDIDVLQAFGDYSRDNWFGAPDFEDVKAHLKNLFPEKFADQEEPPEGHRTDTDLAA